MNRLYFGSTVNGREQNLQRKNLSLDGKWEFKLDPGNSGSFEKTGGGKFNDTIMVPGAIQAQGFGGRQPHFISQMGHTALQVEKNTYSGAAWYRKDFTVSETMEGKEAWLKFGGVHPKAEIWLNAVYLGETPGSFISFKFNVTGIARQGKNRCVIHIHPPVASGFGRCSTKGGVYTWAVSWNGIYRSVELEYTEPAWIERVSIFPSLNEGLARIRADIMKRGKGKKNLELSFRVFSASGINGVQKTRVSFNGKTKRVAPTVKLKNITPWSLDNPRFTHAEVTLSEGSRVIDRMQTRFGMRDLSVRGRQFLLNGTPVYIRGFGYNCIFPRTLSPDLDPQWIKKQMRRAKEYGFNAMDIYAIPYPEFLDIADEEGMLLQIFPGDLLAGGLKHKGIIQQVILENINHPSIFSYGWSAEIYHNKPALVKNLDRLYNFAKKADPARLVLGRGGSLMENTGYGKSDYEELAGFRDISSNFDRLLKEKVASPVIMHEVGWWSSYPNPALKKKYAGCAMLPFFITFAAEVARKKNMENLLPLFVKNSENLQALERKNGLEAIRKTSRVSGYYLWMGHDTVSAVEGVWDDFGDPKNVTAKEFLEYNGKTVLLMEQDFRGRDCWTSPKNSGNDKPAYGEPREMQGRTLWSGEHLRLKFLLSHYGSFPVKNALLNWQIREGDTGKSLACGKIDGINAKNFTLSGTGILDIAMAQAAEAKKVRLHATLSVPGHEIRNSWNFWIFPKNLPGGEKGIYVYHNPRWAPTDNVNTGRGADFRKAYAKGSPWNCWPCLKSSELHEKLAKKEDVRVMIAFNTFGTELIDFIKNGGRALLVNDNIFPTYFGGYNAIPWHRTPVGNSGTIIAPHPCMKEFPHEGWCDLHFYDMIKPGPVNLDIWPARINPIIRSIDSYMGCRSRGLLFEVCVGKGTLMVSALSPADTPASRFMFSRLVEYLYSGNPAAGVSVDEEFLRLFARSN